MRPSRPVIVLSLVSLVLAGCNARTVEPGSDTGYPESGAHAVHLAVPLPLPDRPDNKMSCPECHDAAYRVTLEGATAKANQPDPKPKYDYKERTCSNVYCHAGGTALPLGGGTITVPVWDPPSTVVCGGCHAAPSGKNGESWHPVVAANVQCVMCHPGYTNTSVNPELHVNTLADLDPPTLGTSCAACHGLATRSEDPVDQAAPPKDRFKSSDTRMPGVGAHQAHLHPEASTTLPQISSPIACTACHEVPSPDGPDPLAHVGPTPTSPAKLRWSGLAEAAGAVPAYDRVNGTCTNYCHGQTLAGGGGRITDPLWTKVDGTQAACGTCHGSPPTDGSHELHASPGSLFLSCGTCHPTGYEINAVGPAVVAIHVNGDRNVNETTLPLWNATAQGPTGWTGTSTIGCHGGTRYWTPGTIPGTGCY